MSEDLKLAYSGSRVEGLFIKEMLEESNIHFISKDTFQSSIQAGWADGLPDETIQIYVETMNFEKAKKIIEEYIIERDKE